MVTEACLELIISANEQNESATRSIKRYSSIQSLKSQSTLPQQQQVLMYIHIPIPIHPSLSSPLTTIYPTLLTSHLPSPLKRAQLISSQLNSTQLTVLFTPHTTFLPSFLPPPLPPPSLPSPQISPIPSQSPSHPPLSPTRIEAQIIYSILYRAHARAHAHAHAHPIINNIIIDVGVRIISPPFPHPNKLAGHRNEERKKEGREGGRESERNISTNAVGMYVCVYLLLPRGCVNMEGLE